MWHAATLLAALFLFQADYQAEGLKALDRKQYDQAAQLFGQAVAADPKDYAAHFNLALCYSLADKPALAIPEYRKTLELKPGLYEAELNLGMLLLREKQAADAAPHLNAAVTAKPRVYRPQFYLAEALAATGDVAQAEPHYRAALEIDPKAAAAELGLARALARQNHLPDAADHYRAAAQLNPTFNDALLELAAHYEKQGQPAEAIAIYEKFPADVAAQERRGELLLEAEHYSEAIPLLEKSVEQSPTPANRLALATAYQMNHEPLKAIPLLLEAVKTDLGNYGLRMIYGRALRDAHRFADAAPQFFAATQIKPDSKEAWNDLAGALTLADEYPRALAALDRVRALGQETPGNYYLRAIILDKLHQFKPALESYEKFLATSEGHNPDEEFKARQRVRILLKDLGKR
jgi:tetratricopeptide (TPR) repeat protein